MITKHKVIKKKIQYIENNQTRVLSKICKDAGYSKCLCHIWRDHLYFNDPATPEDYGIWFSYGENGWQKTCRTIGICGMTRYTKDCANSFQMELKGLRLKFTKTKKLRSKAERLYYSIQRKLKLEDIAQRQRLLIF